jgi:hypothetical protein
MNNPPQQYSPANSSPLQLKSKRRLWIILGTLLLALIILLVACAALLLGVLTADFSNRTLAIGAVSLVVFSIGTLLLIIFIGVIYYTVRTGVQRKIRAAQDWPETEGQVLVSEVRDEGGENGWRAHVVYRYEVDGRVYENSRIAVAVEYGREGFQAQEELAARFPAGAPVTVYYNPQNPAEAALIKESLDSSSPSLF